MQSICLFYKFYYSFPFSMSFLRKRFTMAFLQVCTFMKYCRLNLTVLIIKLCYNLKHTHNVCVLFPVLFKIIICHVILWASISIYRTKVIAFFLLHFAIWGYILTKTLNHLLDRNEFTKMITVQMNNVRFLVLYNRESAVGISTFF